MRLRHPAIVGTATMLFALAGAAIGSSAQAAGYTFVPCGNAAGLVTAVNNANSGGPTTIVLAPGCTYTLTQVADSVFAGDNGLPHVTSHITFAGFNSTIARSASAPAFRLLEVDPGASVSLNSITLTGASGTFGGAYANQGTITLNGSTVTGNQAANSGAGGFNYFGATASINASTIRNNSGGSGGGGMLNDGTLSLTRSTVSGNSSFRGGGLVNVAGTATLNGTSVTGNTATDTGGGIYQAGGSVVLQSSNVSGNTPNNCAPPNTVPGCVG